MKVDDTPYDVWSVITTYLPNRDVENLCGVNRQLRPVGLEKRFNHVKFHDHDRSMKKLCEMLCQAEVAPHVRKLAIEPWLVQPRRTGCASLGQNLWSRVNTIFNPKFMEQEAQKRVQKRIGKDIKRIIGAVRSLDNVQEYQILHDERRRYHPELIEAFLSPILTLISRSLLKLTIKVPFDFLEHLSYVRLPQLQTLDICICTGETHMEKVKHALDGCFVFIHNLRELEHFGISATSSSRYLDISYFSERWGRFPRLKSFSLSIPFNGGLLISPEDFYRYVIKPHATTLEKLTLYGTCCGLSPGRLPPDSQFWVQRLMKASFSTPFPCLREAELALRPLKAEYRITDLQTFLRLRSPTLEKLSLMDRALNVQELGELFKSLCTLDAYPLCRNHTLESLDIKVDILSAGVILLIAQRFPRLKSLGIVFSDIVSAEMDPSVKLTVFQFSLSPYKSTVFTTWTLRNLKLVESTPTLTWLSSLERIFRQTFPPTLNIGDLPSSTN